MHQSMIDHAVGIGRGSRNTNSALSMARHAAYGVFLKKLFARDIHLGVTQPPPKKLNKDKKARKGKKPWSRWWSMLLLLVLDVATVFLLYVAYGIVIN